MSLNDAGAVETPSTTTPAETPLAPMATAAKQGEPEKSEDEVLAEIYREAAAAGDGEKPKQTIEEEAAEEPKRGPDGKFLPKETAMQAEKPVPTEPKVEEKAAKPDEAAAAEETADPVDAADDEQSGLAKKDWSEKKRAAFDKLPKDAQTFVLNHHRELIGAAAKEKAEFQTYATATRPYVETIQKNAQYLDRVSRELGVPPHEIIGNLMATESALRTGTFQQKVSVLQAMAQDYGVPITIADQDPLSEPHQPGGEYYREIHDLRQEIASLKALVASQEAATARSQEQNNYAEIERFRTATDTNGQPLHPHFEMVAPRMGQLISEGQAATLEDAYRIATEPMRKAIEAALAQKLRAERQAGAQRAGRINVTTEPAPVAGFDNEDDALRHAFRTAMSG